MNYVNTIQPVIGNRPAVRLRFHWRERTLALLERGLARCPILTMTSVMVMAGVGMVMAVGLIALAAALPMGLLFGWF